MRGSAQLAGAHNPLGARLSQEKGAPESVVCVLETLSEERPGEQRGSWVPRGGVLPRLAPRGHLGTGFVLDARPRPRRGRAANPREVGMSRGERIGVVAAESRRGSPGVSLPHPMRPGGRRSGRAPPLPALGLRAPPAPTGTVAGAPRELAPPPENQTGLAASQPIRGKMSQP